MVTYIITNLINSKCYVGITVNTHKRWLDHRHGRGSKLLYRAFNKYGIENFLFEVIFNGTYQEVKDKEIELIEELSAMVPYGYNLTLGGEGALGYVPSEETRRKLSETSTGRLVSEETRRKLSEKNRGEKHPMFGKHHSEESRQKIGKGNKGEKNHNFGKPLPEEVKQNLRIKQLGHRASPETRQKIREASLGRKHSDETRRKMSKRLQGNTFSLGIKRSLETRQKLSRLNSGSLNARAKSVEIDGVKYKTLKEAALAIGLTPDTLRYARNCFKRTGKWPKNFKHTVKLEVSNEPETRSKSMGSVGITS